MNGILVRNYCSKTCDMCPTACQDTDQKFNFPWSSKSISCKKWISVDSDEKINNRCKFVDLDGFVVKDYCPKTCGLCSTCKDSKQEFKFPWNSKKISCKKLFKSADTDKKVLNRCKKEDENGLLVKDLCILTCGTCK